MPAPMPLTNGGGVKEWIQTKLKSLCNILAWLADKATGSLPAIIGTLVNWLFKTASAAVGCLAQNVWALKLAVESLLYVAAVVYIKLILD